MDRTKAGSVRVTGELEESMEGSDGGLEEREDVGGGAV